MKARGVWKLKFDDLMREITLFDKTETHYYKKRLWLLGDQGFVNLTYKDMDQNIEDVEILVDQPIEAFAEIGN